MIVKNVGACNKPENKILKILILGGGPIGLFIGYKLLKKGNEITIFEKRKKYTRHNILSLQETSKMDTLSLIPSEIMDELNDTSSFSHVIANIDNDNKKCCKNIFRNKPYFMVSSRVYYIVLNELETAYEKHFKIHGGNLIRPHEIESYTNIRIEENLLKYNEGTVENEIDMSKFDIIFINDGANSYYRNIYFKQTSYIENIEDNITRYGLTKELGTLKTSTNPSDIEPLAYGLILIYDIQNKEEFQERFKTQDKLKKRTDFDSVLKFENKDSKFLNGLSVKEVLVENNQNKKDVNSMVKYQNLFRMFISENYMYISIMVNPRDVGDYAKKIPTQNIPYNDLPKNIQLYIMFALYYFDLSELIDITSENNTIKMFPLTFACVNQSFTFIRVNGNGFRKGLMDSSADIFAEKYFEDKCEYDILPKDVTKENHYKIIALCGDAVCSGNFHSGIVLNRNLIGANNICQLIDEYIDAYPKDHDGHLNNNFLRLLFFHGNLINQRARNEIITKSVDALINYGALDRDESVFDLPYIMEELKDCILCKNCTDKKKPMCKNSAAFVKFMIDNSENEVMKRILKYLFLPNKYKYNEVVENIISMEAHESFFM